MIHDPDGKARRGLRFYFMLEQQSALDRGCIIDYTDDEDDEHISNKCSKAQKAALQKDHHGMTASDPYVVPQAKRAMSVYTIIGGVSGCGKSSLTGTLVAERSDLGVVVDSEKLIAACGGDEYVGGRRAVQQLEQALADGVSFTQETTLSGGYPRKLVQRAKSAGYTVRLYYVGLNDLDEHLHRIENRVRKGGHNIPAVDVARRFSRRFDDVIKILPYCDEAQFFDNDNGFLLVASYRCGKLDFLVANPPAWCAELAERLK